MPLTIRTPTILQVTSADDELRPRRDVGRLLVPFHAAVKDSVDPVRLGEDGGVADAQAHAKTKAEHYGQVLSIVVY